MENEWCFLTIAFMSPNPALEEAVSHCTFTSNEWDTLIGVMYELWADGEKVESQLCVMLELLEGQNRINLLFHRMWTLLTSKLASLSAKATCHATQILLLVIPSAMSKKASCVSFIESLAVWTSRRVSHYSQCWLRQWCTREVAWRSIICTYEFSSRAKCIQSGFFLVVRLLPSKSRVSFCSPPFLFLPVRFISFSFQF